MTQPAALGASWPHHFWQFRESWHGRWYEYEIFIASCTDNIYDLENERWLLGDMIDHVGIYGSRVAEGLSAFNVGLVYELLRGAIFHNWHSFALPLPILKTWNALAKCSDLIEIFYFHDLICCFHHQTLRLWGVIYTAQCRHMKLHPPPQYAWIISSSLAQKCPISQMIFSEAFSWMKNFVFWLKFHWSLFLMVQLTIAQHWFR